MSQFKFRVVTGTLSMVIVAMLGWTMQERSLRSAVKKDLDKERLRTESLTAENLSVEKDRDQARKQADHLNAQYVRLTGELQSATEKTETDAGRLRQLKSEVSARSKEYNSLQSSHEQLQHQYDAIASERNKLERMDEQLHAEIFSLRTDNTNLRQELDASKRYRYDSPMIRATRGANNKLVVKASRAKKLLSTISLTNQVDDLKIVVVDPGGTTMTEREGLASSRVLSKGKDVQVVEIAFTPKRKLQPGLYQIEVVSGEVHIASLQVPLQ